MGAQFGPQQYGDLSKLRWDSELPPWLSQTFSYSFRGIKRSGVSGGLSKQVTVLTTREHFTAEDFIAVRKCGLQKEPALRARSHSQSLEGQADVCSLSPGKGSAFGWGKPVAAHPARETPPGKASSTAGVRALIQRACLGWGRVSQWRLDGSRQ